MSKKILFYVGMLLLFAVGFAGCSSDDDSYDISKIDMLFIQNLNTNTSETAKAYNACCVRNKGYKLADDNETTIEFYYMTFRCSIKDSKDFYQLDVHVESLSDTEFEKLEVGKTFDITDELSLAYSYEFEARGLYGGLSIESGIVKIIDKKVVDGDTILTLKINCNSPAGFSIEGIIEYELQLSLTPPPSHC